jgi:carboxymethylenebutenolidase
MGQRAGILERDEPAVFVAEPSGVGSAPRIVIAPEVFGLTPWIKSVARRLAAEGFRAIAPEIFIHDDVPLGKDRASWMARISRLDKPRAVAELRAALFSLPEGPTGVIGFCLGGALSILVAAEGGVDACVDCYGRPSLAIDAAPKVQCPVLAVYGKRDAGIPVEDGTKLAKAVPKAELVLYDAGHAFLNDTRDTHDEAAATLAWPKIIGFLRRNLG